MGLLDDVGAERGLCGRDRRGRDRRTAAVRYPIESGDRDLVSLSFYIGAVVMFVGGVIELLCGLEPECSNLEEVAQPLTAAETDR